MGPKNAPVPQTTVPFVGVATTERIPRSYTRVGPSHGRATPTWTSCIPLGCSKSLGSQKPARQFLRHDSCGCIKKTILGLLTEAEARSTYADEATEPPPPSPSPPTAALLFPAALAFVCRGIEANIGR